jgi:sulfhydrogenase subunit gamma (sulfur reductase)
MANEPTLFTVEKVAEETSQLRLLSLKASQPWSFIPGQVAVLGIEGVGESYFAIASAPEDKGAMEFLVKDGGKGAAAVIFKAKPGDKVQGKGPVGKGFPIDNYHGRDLLIAAVGSAIAPMRSVIRSITYRRQDFGKVTAVLGMRYPGDFPFLKEAEAWKKANITVILTISKPEGTNWTGKTGYVSTHFAEALKPMNNPAALICGMKAMMEQSRSELVRLGVAANDVLTNY